MNGLRWRKRDLGKAGVIITGMLLILVSLAWTSVSAVDAHEVTLALATRGMVTVQATPTEDATVTALSKEKLEQEIQQLKNQNAWSWTNIAAFVAAFGTLGTVIVGVGTGILGYRQWRGNRHTDREKQDEDRFQTVVAGLGNKDIEARAGAAIMMLTFLQQPGYEKFYQPIFNLAVTYLRPLQGVDPGKPEPDAFSQALFMVFKESFHRARERLGPLGPTGYNPNLDGSRVRLDKAYLAGTDLKNIWMREASLIETNLSDAILIEADLKGTNFSRADLGGVNLTGARLGEVDFTEVKLRDAILLEAKLKRAKFNGADLTRANLTGADLRDADFTGANITQEQLEKAKDLRGTIMPDGTKRSVHLAQGNAIPLDSDETPAIPSPPNPAS